MGNQYLEYVRADRVVDVPMNVFEVPSDFDGGSRSKARLRELALSVRRAVDPWSARRELGRLGYNWYHDFPPKTTVGTTSGGCLRIVSMVDTKALSGVKQRSRVTIAYPGDYVIVSPLFDVSVWPGDMFDELIGDPREVVAE